MQQRLEIFCAVETATSAFRCGGARLVRRRSPFDLFFGVDASFSLKTLRSQSIRLFLVQKKMKFKK
jgi:hypothetical protein